MGKYFAKCFFTLIFCVLLNQIIAQDYGVKYLRPYKVNVDFDRLEEKVYTDTASYFYVFDKDALRHLSKFSNLKIFEIGLLRGKAKLSLDYEKQFKNVEYLELVGTKISFEKEIRFPKLKVLQAIELKTKNLEWLYNLPEIEEIYLVDCAIKINQKQFEVYESLRILRIWTLNKVYDLDVSNLKKLEGLHFVSEKSVILNEDYLRLKKLKTLGLNLELTNHQNLDILAGLKSLNLLYVAIEHEIDEFEEKIKKLKFLTEIRILIRANHLEKDKIKEQLEKWLPNTKIVID